MSFAIIVFVVVVVVADSDRDGVPIFPSLDWFAIKTDIVDERLDHASKACFAIHTHTSLCDDFVCLSTGVCGLQHLVETDRFMLCVVVEGEESRFVVVVVAVVSVSCSVMCLLLQLRSWMMMMKRIPQEGFAVGDEKGDDEDEDDQVGHGNSTDKQE